MGFDKAFLQWHGRPLLQVQTERLQACFAHVLLVCDTKEKFAGTQYEHSMAFAEDGYPGTGPLGAVCTALLQTAQPYVFVMACDMPYFDKELLAQLWQLAINSEADVAMCTHSGHDEPLFAFYHRRCLALFEAQLAEGDYRLRGSFAQLNVKKMEVNEARAAVAFANLNTKEELENSQSAHETVPNLVQVGAFGRNDGKTTLACRIIEQLSRQAPVIAVKLICVEDDGGHCHRGGAGCGMCTGLQGPFDCRVETDENSGKDTALMKKAGATQAYLLRSRKHSMAKAFTAFLQEHVPHGALVVCESNRLRFYVKPGVFLFAAENLAKQKDIKPQASELSVLADCVVEKGCSAPQLHVSKTPNGSLRVALQHCLVDIEGSVQP